MKRLAGAALLAVPLLAAAQEPCLKEVFNRYCLGGPIAPVLEAAKPVFKQERGATTVYAFKEGAEEEAFVAAFDGKISAVSRRFKPDTMVTFARVRTQLVELYGQPKRDATLPPYTRGDTAAIENAIAVGRGRVVDQWQREGWRINLAWDNRGIMLLYSHDALRDARRTADPNPQGF